MQTSFENDIVYLIFEAFKYEYPIFIRKIGFVTSIFQELWSNKGHQALIYDMWKWRQKDFVNFWAIIRWNCNYALIMLILQKGLFCQKISTNLTVKYFLAEVTRCKNCAKMQKKSCISSCQENMCKVYGKLR